MEQKKVTFFLGSMNKGGAERVISILSRDYAQHGYQTDICMLLYPAVNYDLDPTTKTHDFSGKSSSRINNLPYWLKTIRSFVKQENPDVIVSFSARINVIVMIACLGLFKKIVISERNDPKYDGRGKVTKLLTALLYPKAASVAFQTKRVQSYFSKKVRDKGTVIPNPIEVSCMAENTDENKIVNVGRLNEQKNHVLLVKAFAQIVKEYPEKKLFIYGEGPMRSAIEACIEENGMQNNVILAGQKADVHKQIKDASIFVLSSNYEGLSNALLEAMMMGLPCISTDCAGSDEYIINGENGLLTPVGDVDALYIAMRKFIEDDDLRKICGENAKKVADRVSTDKTLVLWRAVIG